MAVAVAVGSSKSFVLFLCFADCVFVFIKFQAKANEDCSGIEDTKVLPREHIDLFSKKKPGVHLDRSASQDNKLRVFLHVKLPT